MSQIFSDKMNLYLRWFLLALYADWISKCIGDFSECHDDFDLNPRDGILKSEHNSFNWLGFIRYSHKTLGVPHPTLAPRVILVHRQFVLGATEEVEQPPYDYKLSHIVFGKYEREEAECDLKQSQANMGLTCGPAYIEMPHSQIITHPEHTRFAVGNSLTLIKLLRPMKSQYMIPICLPSRFEREAQRKQKSVWMIDYTSSVPENFNEDIMAKKTLQLLTRSECERHRRNSNLDKPDLTYYVCTSGCGIRKGAPIITHSLNGPLELVGIAVSSCLCTEKQMRSTLNNDPPVFIDIYPYVNWITNVITAHIIPHAYPSKILTSSALERASGRRLMKAGREIGVLRARVKQKEGWIRRVFKVGNQCFVRRAAQRSLSVFYVENFEVLSGKPTRLRVFIKISAGIECTIVCARIALPNRMTRPIVEGIGGYNITIQFRTEWFPFHFYFKVGLMGTNTTAADLKTFLNERPPEGYWTKK